jgi:hypothetical protein
MSSPPVSSKPIINKRSFFQLVAVKVAKFVHLNSSLWPICTASDQTLPEGYFLGLPADLAETGHKKMTEQCVGRLAADRGRSQE